MGYSVHKWYQASYLVLRIQWWAWETANQVITVAWLLIEKHTTEAQGLIKVGVESGGFRQWFLERPERWSRQEDRREGREVNTSTWRSSLAEGNVRRGQPGWRLRDVRGHGANVREQTPPCPSERPSLATLFKVPSHTYMQMHTGRWLATPFKALIIISNYLLYLLSWLLSSPKTTPPQIKCKILRPEAFVSLDHCLILSA